MGKTYIRHRPKLDNPDKMQELKFKCTLCAHETGRKDEHREHFQEAHVRK